MVVQPNGTDAKEIALYFHQVTSVHPSSRTMGKAIIQAKRLLRDYSKTEIIHVIDLVVQPGVRIYSLGYIEACIDDVIAEERQQVVAKQIAQEFATHAKEKQQEVLGDDESTDRNREKLDRFGVQRRFGEKHNFDLFERP